MNDEDLATFAEQAGIASHWWDAFGQEHRVAPPTLRAVLASLGLPAWNESDLAESRARLHGPDGPGLPPLITAPVRQPLHLPAARGSWHLRREDGGVQEGTLGEDGALPGFDVPGYHQLELGGQQVTLAVAPERCWTPADANAARAWGLAVQLYSLRRAGDGGIGDFRALEEFAGSAARRGADTVAISPVHAQFSADPDRFSPYAPSSRIMLNAVHAAVNSDTPGGELIDWPGCTRKRLALLREHFAPSEPGFPEFRARLGEALERHARFEALHAHFFGADPGRWHWRSWPAEFHDPASPAVAAFAEQHAHEVAFHAWLQFRAAQGLQAAQDAARQGGMRIGLIADLAVGTDSGGSHSWSRQDETLIGLTIGAPPDLLARQGQNWGVVAFSPRGLRQHGFAAFLEMLRAALRHAGGVRIDHAMSLMRLWVIPEGAGATEGAYLRFPLEDLLRLTVLESWRHKAAILGEDLGTVPEGFQPKLQSAGIFGMRVLWFERNETGFKPPGHWTREAVAMTSTHDLPTVAGWWTGRDLEWRSKLGLVPDEPGEWGGRDRDRSALWRAFRESGAADGDPPRDPTPVIDAAVAHVASAACELMLLPAEDAVGSPEQPNLPGTLHEHPNWQRRLPDDADRILDRPDVAARLDRLAQIRPRA
ncbi:MAG: 4-alpha-glucanotransferase [Acetobacteraceae bacterium]|nr:4-alpha-glucanotransferase [Acetobacteraceae bacterium]